MSRDDANPQRLYERVPGSGVKLWLLLGASRWAVTALVLAVLFVGIVGVLLLEPTAFDRELQEGYPVQSLFQSLVTAIVTGVTLVVTINSLVLSQELGPAGRQREKMDDSTAFREAVAELIGEPVSPADPAAFLRSMLEATGDRAAALRAAVEPGTDDPAGRAITGFADAVERDADHAADQLKTAEFGTFAVVAGSLEFDYSAKLHEGKGLAGTHADTIGDDAGARLDEVLELLHLYGPAREHVKTLYFQWELVDLSRAMLYAAVPALVVASACVLVLGDPGMISGRTLGLANQGWVVAGAATVALSPFAILLAYILRIGTAAKRTLAIGPFVLRGQAGSEEESE